MTCVTVVDKDIYQFFGGKDVLEGLKVGIRQKTSIRRIGFLMLLSKHLTSFSNATSHSRDKTQLFRAPSNLL